MCICLGALQLTLCWLPVYTSKLLKAGPRSRRSVMETPPSVMERCLFSCLPCSGMTVDGSVFRTCRWPELQLGHVGCVWLFIWDLSKLIKVWRPLHVKVSKGYRWPDGGGDLNLPAFLCSRRCKHFKYSFSRLILCRTHANAVWVNFLGWWGAKDASSRSEFVLQVGRISNDLRAETVYKWSVLFWRELFTKEEHFFFY